MKRFGFALIFVSCILGLGLITYGSVQSIQFTRNCKGYLKRAADANTIHLARQELTKAVRYLEETQLMSGSTHVIYATPECELDFWYQNLKSSLIELESFPEGMDPLTVSNQLLKLRETLMDNGEHGTKVTAPSNVHVFPNQFQYRMGGVASLLGLGSGFMIVATGSQCDPAGDRTSHGKTCNPPRSRHCIT